MRLSLALIIMAAHLTESLPLLKMAEIALMGFYFLAGFSGVLSRNRYSFWEYLCGRFIRIWPTYAVLFVGLSILYLVVPITIGRTAMPWGWEWLSQLFMIVPHYPAPALIPPAWMISNLFLGYLAIAANLLSSPQASVGVAIISSIGVGLSTNRYYSWPLALLMFAAGAIAYYCGLKIPRHSTDSLAFPAFLVHYAIGGVMPFGLGWPLFFAALPPTLALSWLLVVAVERPVQRFRSSLRSTP